MTAAHTPIRASTQEHLDIQDIKEDIVIFKDGSCCLILQTTAVNFGLLSEREQDATIYAYAELLNSLSFQIQIVIRSKKKDISAYLDKVREQERKEKSKKIKDWIQNYREFIEDTVQDNEILDKKFYVVIPFSTTELGVTSSIKSNVSKNKKLPYPKEYILEKAKNNLYPKRDHMMKQLARIGLKTKQLNTQELIKLYYHIYNPDSEGQQFVEADAYQQPMVSAAVEKKDNG
jgi:hypothetical protein